MTQQFRGSPADGGEKPLMEAIAEDLGRDPETFEDEVRESMPVLDLDELELADK